MFNFNQPNLEWENLRIGITGANGSLGKALTKNLRSKGSYLIGLSHSLETSKRVNTSENSPHEWVKWSCGKEIDLDEILSSLNILVLNHGVNTRGKQETKDINTSLDVNFISTWKLIERFEELSLETNRVKSTKEIWVNTSEAEIQPALSPTYEISKRLLGEVVSLRQNNPSKAEMGEIRIRKLILGPFKSQLNPIGIMSADFVASQILKQVNLNLNLIIVTPNPITYFLMPITEIMRYIYSAITKKYFS